MNDNNHTSTQTRQTDRKPTREDGRPMKMKEMDHTPPVEGPNRTFERDNEGQPARADGGQRPADDSTAKEPHENGDDRFRQKMKEMDHTPPVEGPNRTFERGNESDAGGEK